MLQAEAASFLDIGDFDITVDVSFNDRRQSINAGFHQDIAIFGTKCPE